MMYHLLFPLREFFFPFNVFGYITFRSALAAVTAIVISFAIGPRLIAYLRLKQLGQQVREEGPATHLAKQGTPTMGGLLILASILLPVLLWVDLTDPLIWIVIASTSGFGLIGLWDDLLKVRLANSQGLSVSGKLVAQVILATAVGFILWRSGFSTMLTVPFFKEAPLDLGVLFIPFTVLVLVGAANAVNLTDGLDGLAIGTTGVAMATYTVLAYCAGHAVIARYLGIPYVSGSGELAIFGAAAVGASLGFLWFNCHPAEVFMGDVGSMALGAAIGTMAVVVKQEILLVLVGGMFVMEALSVLLQVASYRWRNKRRVFRMAPLHHHYELGGWDETKVVIRFWILAIIFALASLATLKLR
jgi:phospho-N-acetylmuramoyl-pentapeptide-transferase